MVSNTDGKRGGHKGDDIEKEGKRIRQAEAHGNLSLQNPQHQIRGKIMRGEKYPILGPSANFLNVCTPSTQIEGH